MPKSNMRRKTNINMIVNILSVIYIMDFNNMSIENNNNRYIQSVTEILERLFITNTDCKSVITHM